MGAARVDLSLQPRVIDPGDRTRIQVRVWDVHPNGISLKLRFPDALTYVPESSTLEVNGTEREVDPTIVQPDNKDVYIVYYFDQSTFGSDGNEEGILTLELEGVKDIEDGQVEVDPDVDDPALPNTSEFDINNPEFQAESSGEITVRE